MISAQTLRVCREENRYPLFRIMLLLWPSARDDLETLIVVFGHVVDEVDLPGEVFAHRGFAVRALARHEKGVIGRVSHPRRAGLERQPRRDPRLRAAGKCQYPTAGV